MLLDQFLRYRKIAEFIEQQELNTILEVGSGSHGVAEYISKSVVGCDLSFRDYGEVPRKTHPRLTPVLADGRCLPFKDKSFELVLSSDMLEHVPPLARKDVINEMCRVAAHMVILTCPCGYRAYEYDKRLQRFYERRKEPIPGWLNEHLEQGFPSEEEIISILNERGLEFHIEKNENLWLQYMLMVLESYSFWKFKLAAIAELTNQYGDVPGNLSLRARLVQLLLRGLSFMSSLIDRGPVYRKVFIIQVRRWLRT